jgi:acetyltransferase-like isoleucine patch superfamily enzyme
MNPAAETVYLWRRAAYTARFVGRPIRVHPTAWVSARSTFRTRGRRGSITIGAHCEIHPYAMLLTYGGDIRVGEHCSLNPFSIVYGHGGVTIGDGVRIAAHTVIVPGNHNKSADGQPVYRSGVTARGIRIGDNVWIGAGVRILDGVEIGRDVVIGAGSVVTKSVPAGQTVAGVPACSIGRQT